MNPPAALYSHFEPRLRLQTHLAEVGTAVRFLLGNHSAATRQRRVPTAAVAEALVACHDLGKGSPAFQQYIQAPGEYRGDPRAKAHSNLSAALAILWARSSGWRPLEILALAQIVAGHHAGFANGAQLRERLRPDDEGLLATQWAGLDRTALEAEAGLDLRCLAGGFREAGRWLFRREETLEQLAALPLEQAVDFRIWTQFLFSILLEADKAFLALRQERLDRYLHPPHPDLHPDLVQRHLDGLPASPLNPLRSEIRREVLSRLGGRHRLHTLTLPTGVGKTLLAATWALEYRRRLTAPGGSRPRIIVVLPYLSIIDQVEQEYRQLLGARADGDAQSERVMASHSIAYREYELEGHSPGEAYTRFFLDTWRSEVVLTTFDQLLLSLFSTRTRHLMRCHHLLDALIVLDEVQTLPCRLWNLVDHGLRALTREGQTHILMMSATQPALLTAARELAGDPPQVAAIFARFRRYRVHCRHRQGMDLDTFIDELMQRLTEWIDSERRVLVTLNTRNAARSVWDALSQAAAGRVPVWLISADIAPRDRLHKVARIKRGLPCIVVSTQTIEAGVDIDMDLTLRDFAPLDAIVQVAGRCNRNNRLGDHGGRVELLSLRSSKGRRYAETIYDPVLLDASRNTLEGLDSFAEEQVLELSRAYFDRLKARMDTGSGLTRAFARWQDWDHDIHTLLRGERQEQVCFVTAQEEERGQLAQRMQMALDIEDRWERREALRRLAPELQRRSVCVYARPGLHPEDHAESLGPYWLLHPGRYNADAGLILEPDVDAPACIL